MNPNNSFSMLAPYGAQLAARANIRGNAAHPTLTGYMNAYPYHNGVLLVTELWGLPFAPGPCADNVLGLHIHEVGECAQKPGAPAFENAGGHYNPRGCPHPAHAGDLPPLFSCGGYALQGVYTDRLTIKSILGRSVIVHSQRDDFTSQPAGDAGTRIGCGVIQLAR